MQPLIYQLGTNYTLYGVDILREMSQGREWEQSGLFPRVTWCDFEVWSVNNRHRFSVQCTHFIEFQKIFVCNSDFVLSNVVN